MNCFHSIFPQQDKVNVEFCHSTHNASKIQRKSKKKNSCFKIIFQIILDTSFKPFSSKILYAGMANKVYSKMVNAGDLQNSNSKRAVRQLVYL